MCNMHRWFKMDLFCLSEKSLCFHLELIDFLSCTQRLGSEPSINWIQQWHTVWGIWWYGWGWGRDLSEKNEEDAYWPENPRFIHSSSPRCDGWRPWSQDLRINHWGPEGYFRRSTLSLQASQERWCEEGDPYPCS